MEGFNLMVSLSALNFHFPTGVIFTPEVYGKPTPTPEMEVQLIDNEVFNSSLFHKKNFIRENCGDSLFEPRRLP